MALAIHHGYSFAIYGMISLKLGLETVTNKSSSLHNSLQGTDNC